MERQYQLHQKVRLDKTPHHLLSLIKFNGTFLESVDRDYAWKGAITFGWGVIILGCLTIIIAMTYAMAHPFQPYRKEEVGPALAALIFVYLLCGTVAYALIRWGLAMECWGQTHYPIRLNRNSRLVYAFRPDGTVLSASWDKIFFTVANDENSRGTRWNIRALILADDGETIIDTFTLSPAESSPNITLLEHWEFIRRYMEDGPAEIQSSVTFLWPIDSRSETFRTGLNRLLVPFVPDTGPVGRLVLLPFLALPALTMLPLAVGRWFAMHTSKVPIWPQEIETACVIVPEDPFAKDASMNPAFPPSLYGNRG